ncbi:circularly permuted type 2 ATP-grasp protein [Mucilaginibacter sp. FT3.2]|uniref:circularly permuted type 2 ATP-grasp protein n=1 Tax=Mucilaginibacter sp. FT3.2 TaxID=2723090 RepID=UPI001616BFC0|nr:circularly permuted type 2 ATP-grasp protein [Mucilaginibacter sp. FT3.2]MBB6232383.1 putative circularly permuted ATP-grasp superfamily protein/putative alpha-E superfamily protein [Mucilaginibacter sp. FT3.2]
MIETYLERSGTTAKPFFDELAAPEGVVREHWKKLAHAYDELGIEKMEQRSREISQELRDNGVTYNVYSDPDGINRPWKLDPVPMVFSQQEWENIEKGLVQRAELLNLILSDIYGERKLIKEGFIPFEMVFTHKGFLRQADKIKIPGKFQLIQYSADLVRGPLGKMWVLHDRTDAPSGAGYTLENRAAMTRVFPDLIRENQVRKISSYYQTLKNTLTKLALQNKENPRVVLLSPGTANETYFEHAYLASSLGFTLVFGQDLTVSDGYVWLKTLKGLEKVDVIVRRVDDIFCDPLEFLGDSHLGVVGLMEAVRQKKVTIINPLGGRILENPGLMAFLPRLCKHLLNEELILPSVATWWCGHEKEKKYVLDNLPFLIIRSIYRSNENRPYIGSELSKKQIEDLRKEIDTRPYLYVAQEVVSFSTTPSLVGNNLEACNAIVRSYIVADMDKEVYHVMPGGLSRSFPTKGEFIISNQTGGISKDTWVLGPSPQSPIKPIVSQPILRQVKNILPSRTGESLFWLGRYLDRAVSNVRMMRVVLKIYNERDDEIHPETNQTLVILLKSLSLLTGTLPGFTAADESKLRQPEKELLSLAVEAGRPGTLAQSLQSFLTNGYAVRDRLSLDTWRILDSISEEFELMKENGNDLRKIYHNLDQFIIKLMAFIGLNNDNMTRASSWRLLNIGRFLESSLNTCTILQAALGNNVKLDVEKQLMELVLMCNESLVTYRYLYRSTLQLPGVFNLLLVNEDNPKSVAFLIAKIDELLSHLPDNHKDGGLSPAHKKLLEALTMIRLCDINKMVPSGNTGDFSKRELNGFLHHLITVLGQASTIIFESYFSPTQNQYSFVKSNNTLPEL